jgi:hypothetical protein
MLVLEKDITGVEADMVDSICTWNDGLETG